MKELLGWWLGLLAALVTPATWRREPLVKRCVCGVLIWDVQYRFQLSPYSARPVCPGCGIDHSRIPTVWWLARFYWRRLLKRRRFFGVVGMWRADYPVPFWEFRPRPRDPKADRPVVLAATTVLEEGSVLTE